MFVKTSLVVILQDKLEVKGYVAISIFITTYSAILNASIFLKIVLILHTLLARNEEIWSPYAISNISLCTCVLWIDVGVCTSASKCVCVLCVYGEEPHTFNALK